MSIAPPVTAPACGAQNLTKVFGEGGPRPVVAVNDVTITIEAGSFTAIMGPSGSGKSTLMHCMAGLDRATSGSVWVGQQDLSRLPERAVTKIRRDQIGFVFQSFNLLPTLTAEQNILLPLELAGRKPDRAVLAEVVESLGLTERLTHRPSQLSGGQQQRVAIVRAIATNPELLLLDEITSALDPVLVGEVLDLVLDLKRTGSTILMATHEIGFARSAADRVVFLERGQIIEQGPPERVIDDPQESATKDFLARVLR